VLAELLSITVRPIIDAMTFMLQLVLLRRLLRSDWLALGGTLIITLLISGSWRGPDPIPSILSYAVLVVVYFVMVRRFGFLALIVAQYVEAVTYVTPALWPPASWHTGITLLNGAVILALALYGFFTSLAGKPLFSGEFAEA
jgi:hypothetical protein